jgi:hypothetical protein
MGLVIDLDKNVGRSVRVVRPSNPGSHILWWDRLRGALSRLAAPSRRGSSEPGSVGAQAALPSLYDHTPASLTALGRVVRDVASVQCSPAHMSCRSSAA